MSSLIPNTRGLLKLGGQSALTVYVYKMYGESLAVQYGRGSKALMFTIESALVFLTIWIGGIVSDMILDALRF